MKDEVLTDFTSDNELYNLSRYDYIKFKKNIRNSYDRIYSTVTDLARLRG